MEETAIALRVLISAARQQPENAPAMWQAARILLNSSTRTQPSIKKAVSYQVKNDDYVVQDFDEPDDSSQTEPEIPCLKAEFDYADENGLHSHRTIYVIALADGRAVKRNSHLPLADRYGYLLTGYCSLRKQIRSFRSSRINNLRTFIEGEPLEPNRQWKLQNEQVAS